MLRRPPGMATPDLAPRDAADLMTTPGLTGRARPTTDVAAAGRGQRIRQ